MKFEIITPDQTLYKGDISLVQVPGIDGSFEILNNHAPLISALKKGQVKIIEQDKSQKLFDIKGGVIEVLKNKVIVLAE